MPSLKDQILDVYNEMKVLKDQIKEANDCNDIVRRDQLENDLRLAKTHLIALNQADAALAVEQMKIEASRAADKALARQKARADEAAKPVLTMADVDAWLNANPLAAEQPTAPMSSLWWRLDSLALNPESAKLAQRYGLGVLIGLPGAGKTRTMYEMLAHNFGFYWTANRKDNRRGSILETTLSKEFHCLDDSDLDLVYDRIYRLSCAYSILLMQWRRKFSNGTAFQWHVFQTSSVVVDAALKPIVEFLESRAVHATVADKVLRAAQDSVESGPLLLHIDEAQVLTCMGRFSSSDNRITAKRQLLTPFARCCVNDLSFRNVWFAGTSLSLSLAEDVGGSRDAKVVKDCVVYSKMAFDEVGPFGTFLRERVGADFSDALIGELHMRFRGRARRVAILAEYLIAAKVAQVNRDSFDARVIQTALVCESDLLSRSTTSTVSIVSAFVRKIETIDEKVLELLTSAMSIAMSTLAGRSFPVHENEYWFDRGIGNLDRGFEAMPSRWLNVTEPLTAKMLVLAGIELDADGVRKMIPILNGRDDMWRSANACVRGFICEVFVAPMIHRYLMRLLGCDRKPALCYFLSKATLCDGLARKLPLFGPEKEAGPDVVHTFEDGTGALGQIKFRKMTPALWEAAKNKTDRKLLYSEKSRAPNPADRGGATRKSNKEALRYRANEEMSARWPKKKYVSYIFSVDEPPAGVKAAQTVGDREILVFSPLLCPDLFKVDGLGVEWKDLQRMSSTD